MFMQVNHSLSSVHDATVMLMLHKQSKQISDYHKTFWLNHPLSFVLAGIINVRLHEVKHLFLVTPIHQKLTRLPSFLL